MSDQIHALKALQMALARLGYYTGAIDGLFGSRTDAALKAVAAERGAIRNEKPLAPSAAPRPMIFQGSARYPVDEIVIHCAATHPDWMRGQPLTAKRKEIERWHREERGWRKIGYHHLIDRDGGRSARSAVSRSGTYRGPAQAAELPRGGDPYQAAPCAVAVRPGRQR
jgi:peptidoglycan hydrolase-like protein with peptidoglycan-binding domain